MTDNRKMINDDELESVSGGKTYEEWAHDAQLRESYYEKVGKVVAKIHGVDWYSYKDQICMAVWYFNVPDKDIEAFILAHCVYKQDLY